MSGTWVKRILLVVTVAIFVSCYPAVEETTIPFSDFAELAKNPSDASIVKVAGVFDLKSICLNFNPHYKATGDCEAYFSEHSGTNAPTQRVSLKVCGEGNTANCIDPLPENAPPEVIGIRDVDGARLAWGRVIIQAKITSADRLTGIEVIKIESVY